MDAFHKLAEKLLGWFEQLILMLPNLAIAIGVVIAFVLAARLVRGLLLRLLRRVSPIEEINGLVGSAAYGALVLCGCFVALGVLGLEKTVMSLLAGVGIVGLALGLAFQEIASNVIAGVFLSLRRPFTAGQTIETGGLVGTVERVRLRSTEIRSVTGPVVLVPNKQLFDGIITNHSLSRAHRIDVRVGVAYDADLSRVRQVIQAALKDVPARDPARAIEVLFEELGDSAIQLVVHLWTDSTRAELGRAKSEAIERIKLAFEAEGITIPYPTRTLRLANEPGERVGQRVAAAAQPRGRLH